MFNTIIKFSLIFYFLIALTFSSTAQIDHAKIKPNSTINIDKNKIKFGASIPMEIIGKTRYSLPNPVYFNGNKIYRSSLNEIAIRPHFLSSELSFPIFLFKKLQPQFNKLEDGSYSFVLDDVVIDEHGLIVYYDYIALRRLNGNITIVNAETDLSKISTGTKKTSKDNYTIPEQTTNAIYKQLDKILSSGIKFSPALLPNGKAVYCDVTDSKNLFFGFIDVKNHAASFRSLTSNKSSGVNIDEQLQMPQY